MLQTVYENPGLIKVLPKTFSDFLRILSKRLKTFWTFAETIAKNLKHFCNV